MRNMSNELGGGKGLDSTTGAYGMIDDAFGGKGMLGEDVFDRPKKRKPGNSKYDTGIGGDFLMDDSDFNRKNSMLAKSSKRTGQMGMGQWYEDDQEINTLQGNKQTFDDKEIGDGGKDYLGKKFGSKKKRGGAPGVVKKDDLAMAESDPMMMPNSFQAPRSAAPNYSKKETPVPNLTMSLGNPLLAQDSKFIGTENEEEICKKCQRQRPENYPPEHNVEWVECERCSNWYHILCVGYRDASELENTEFVCCGNSAVPSF